MLVTHTQAVADGVTLPTLAEADALYQSGVLSASRAYWTCAPYQGDDSGWVLCITGSGQIIPNNPDSLCYVYTPGEQENIPVPLRVRVYEAKLWLLNHRDDDGVSYLSKVMAALNAMPDGDAKYAFDLGLNSARFWDRDSPLVDGMRQLIGLSQADIDQAFREIGDV